MQTPAHLSVFSRIGLLACLAPVLTSVGWAEDDVSAFKKMSMAELMDLEVTSVSRRPEKLSETASSLQVITNDDIRRSGATNIPESLRLASNLQVAQRTANGWAISSRGFNTELGNKLLVLMDGRTVYSPLFSGVFWDVQDYVLEDLDRIEVISGPGGTLWGANAVNGVINITSKSAEETQGFFGETALGTELENLTSLRYGGKLAPEVHYRVYGKFTQRDGAVLDSGADSHVDGETARAGFRIDAHSTPDNTFTFQGDLYDHSQSRAVLDDADLNGGNLLSRWTHTLENDSELSLQIYYDRTRLSQDIAGIPAAPAPGRFTDTLDTYDVDFQHSIFVGDRHYLVWGLGYRRTHNVVQSAPALGFTPAVLDQDLYSAFIQDKITFGDGWAFTLGTKIEHNDYTGVEWEPSGRLQWEITPAQMVWGAVSRAVRMPSRIDRDLRQPSVGPATGVGGEDFASETVIAYELGYRAQVTDRVLASISVFYNHYDDLRSVGPTPVTVLPLTIENNLEGDTYGFELTSTFEVSKSWRLHAGYTFLHSDLRVKSGEIDLNNALAETADPKHQFQLRSSWDLPRRFEFDVGVRWVDTLRVNNAGTAARVPSYYEMDARLAWRPTDDLELSLVGQSLLHDSHLEYGRPGPAREEIQRGVYAKLTWRH